MNPETQRAAQAEIDRVVGAGRLPELKDRDSLPNVEAIVRELFRFYPVIPLCEQCLPAETRISLTQSSAVPHMVTADDEYEGMLIPAQTTIIPNIWCVSFRLSTDSR